MNASFDSLLIMQKISSVHFKNELSTTYFILKWTKGIIYGLACQGVSGCFVLFCFVVFFQSSPFRTDLSILKTAEVVTCFQFP